MGKIRRYQEKESALSPLNHFEDVASWVEGLTRASYVSEWLRAKHSLKGPMTLDQRSKTVAEAVYIACKYLEQSAKGPKEVSFLPLYYALLNLSKAYIAIGPYADELSLPQNRHHGAIYDPKTNSGKLDEDSIRLKKEGAIPLLHRTLVGEESMFQSANVQRYHLPVMDIYAYIADVSLEYTRATGNANRLIPFGTIKTEDMERKQRVVASYQDSSDILANINVATLQAFRGFHRDPSGENRLVSDWYDEGDTAFLQKCLRPAMIYDSHSERLGYQYVPSSSRNLLLPEELPIICAFFHMSSVVRYNPGAFEEIRGSKYWPMVLALRTQGAYQFLLLFWRFVTQCCTYIDAP